jgi:hypothetical protein
MEGISSNQAASGKEEAKMNMKTLHITKFDGYPWLSESEDDHMKRFLSFFSKKEPDAEKAKERERQKYSKMKQLLRDMYDAGLKDDPKFHFRPQWS